MNKKQALRIANEAIKERMKYCVFDANLFRMGQVTPHTTRAYKKHQRLLQAHQILDGELRQGVMKV